MDNKTKILDSALELFHARGYDSVGVQEIAEMAGVTKPTLYYYFGNKQGLLSTLLNLKYEEMKTAVFGNLDECKDFRQRLTRGIPGLCRDEQEKLFTDYGDVLLGKGK